MSYTWLKWLKDWRLIAGRSRQTIYTPVIATLDGKDYEVLCVSKFHEGYDSDKPHVATSIREFNDKTALHSRATRDLGIVRVVTNKGKPTFVIEPGADALEWQASIQGVSVVELVKVTREGDLGRRVRRRDRKAAKDSRAREAALREELEALRGELRSVAEQRDQMRENLIKQNEEYQRQGMVFTGSGTTASPLGMAQKTGYKLTSTRPLPGNFEG